MSFLDNEAATLDYNWENSWPKPPYFPDEEERLDVLRRLAILDTPKDHVYELICDLAGKALNCSNAAVSFIDKDRQWFKASTGIAVTEIPRDVSFCAHTIHSNATVVVADTALDKTFAQNPLVRDAGIRFYAAAPICTPSGHTIGTVCGFDDQPREDGDDCDIAALAQLAAAVLLNLDQQSYGVPWESQNSVTTPSVAWKVGGKLDFFLKQRRPSSTSMQSHGSCDDVCALDCKNAADMEALRSYSIMDTEPEEFFDSICRRASREFSCPIAAVSFMDEERQWFKASVGLGLTEVPRSISICATLNGEPPIVVLDTLNEQRLIHNPFVNGNPRVRFYASAPIVSKKGHVLGSVFILDTEPRKECDATTLEKLASEIMEHLEERKQNVAP